MDHLWVLQGIVNLLSERLKDILTSSPTLKIAYLNEDFVVCTNAWKEGLGGFLTQKNIHLDMQSSILVHLSIFPSTVENSLHTWKSIQISLSSFAKK